MPSGQYLGYTIFYSARGSANSMLCNREEELCQETDGGHY